MRSVQNNKRSNQQLLRSHNLTHMGISTSTSLTNPSVQRSKRNRSSTGSVRSWRSRSGRPTSSSSRWNTRILIITIPRTTNINTGILMINTTTTAPRTTTWWMNTTCSSTIITWWTILNLRKTRQKTTVKGGNPSLSLEIWGRRWTTWRIRDFLKTRPCERSEYRSLYRPQKCHLSHLWCHRRIRLTRGRENR